MFLLESCDTPLNSLKIYWGYFSKDFLCVGYSKFPFFALWRFQCHDRDSIFYWYGVVTIGSNLIDQLGSVVPNFIALCLPCRHFQQLFMFILLENFHHIGAIEWLKYFKYVLKWNSVLLLLYSARDVKKQKEHCIQANELWCYK